MAEAAEWQRVDPTRAQVSGHGNAILASLPGTESSLLFDRMRRARVGAGLLLFEAGEPIRHVFFPSTCVVSLLAVLEDGRGVETATVGREGLIGLDGLLVDPSRWPLRGVVQMSGELLRIDVGPFQDVAVPGSKVDEQARRYAAARMFQIARNVACVSAHQVRPRIARWLLQTADRSGSLDIELTHAFLAEVLAVRRASVSDAVKELAQAGALEVRRGCLTIADRAALEERSCGCYEAVRVEYERMLRLL